MKIYLYLFIGSELAYLLVGYVVNQYDCRNWGATEWGYYIGNAAIVNAFIWWRFKMTEITKRL